MAGIAGLAVAPALFGSGYLAAGALDDGPARSSADTDAVLDRTSPPVPLGEFQRSGTANEASFPAGKGDSGALSMAIAPDQYGCPGVLGDVLRGTSVDLASGGFQPRFLGDGFVLRSLSIRSEGACGTDGRPSTSVGTTILDTSWHHPATGLEVSISQRQTDKPIANVMQGANAMFWAGGYAYSVNVYGFFGLRDMEVVDDGKPHAVSPARAPGVDPQAVALLADVVGRLAPDLGASCFYRESRGGWESLGALGIGDPRPALPDGFKEQSLTVRLFTPPAASCNVAEWNEMNGFDASFVQSGPTGEFGGAIIVGASPVYDAGSAVAGYADDYSANWTNGKWQFFVGAKMKEHPGREAIVAIARALDPSLDVTKLAERPAPTDIKTMPASSPK